MHVLFRRSSPLLLMLSLFLIIAPALLSPLVHAEETSVINIPNMVPMAIQWGIGGIMFTVWFVQFKKSKQNDETLNKMFSDHLSESNKITTLAFEKYNEQNAQLIQLLKDEQDYKTELRGTLERLLIEANVPTKCPILIGQKINIEVLK